MNKKKVHIRAVNMRRAEKGLEIYNASMTLCQMIDRTGSNKFLVTEDPKKASCLRCRKYLVNPPKMEFILIYYHTRDIFKRNEFRPFVKKYFKDVKYLGVESGNSYPAISISNWEEIKNDLPKYARPLRVGLSEI